MNLNKKLLTVGLMALSMSAAPMAFAGAPAVATATEAATKVLGIEAGLVAVDAAMVGNVAGAQALKQSLARVLGQSLASQVIAAKTFADIANIPGVEAAKVSMFFRNLSGNQAAQAKYGVAGNVVATAYTNGIAKSTDQVFGPELTVSAKQRDVINAQVSGDLRSKVEAIAGKMATNVKSGLIAVSEAEKVVENEAMIAAKTGQTTLTSEGLCQFAKPELKTLISWENRTAEKVRSGETDLMKADCQAGREEFANDKAEDTLRREQGLAGESCRTKNPAFQAMTVAHCQK